MAKGLFSGNFIPKIICFISKSNPPWLKSDLTEWTSDSEILVPDGNGKGEFWATALPRDQPDDIPDMIGLGWEEVRIIWLFLGAISS